MGENEERNKLMWVIAGTLLGSVSLNQGINKTFPQVRSDAFTGRDFRYEKDVMRAGLIKDIEARMGKAHDNCRENMERYVNRELEHAVILLEAKMPPHNTRIRIRSIERHIEKADVNFEVPTQAW